MPAVQKLPHQQRKVYFLRKKLAPKVGSSSEDEQILYDDTTDTPSEFEENESEQMDSPAVEIIEMKNISIWHFLKVNLKCIQTGKLSQFVGKVILPPTFEEKPAVKVPFMRPYRNNKDIFIFPQEMDESDISSQEIVGRYTKVDELKYGRIRFQ